MARPAGTDANVADVVVEYTDVTATERGINDATATEHGTTDATG